MKRLHRPDLYGWSRFDEERDMDFHSVFWHRAGFGNVVVDPLPLRWHDLAHIEALGGVAWIVVTSSDHLRASAALAAVTGAQIAGPAGEQGSGLPCGRWLSDGEVVVEGLVALALEGSKTPGELALVLEETTLITGDLVRAHAGGALTTLPQAKLADPAAARRSVARLAALEGIDAVLVGDGWPAFRGGRALLQGALARMAE